MNKYLLFMSSAGIIVFFKKKNRFKFGLRLEDFVAKIIIWLLTFSFLNLYLYFPAHTYIDK